MISKHGWEQCNRNDFWSTIAPEDHVVQIYEDEDLLISTLSDYAADGFLLGDSLIVIATDSHIDSLNEQLINKGFDVDRLIAADLYIPLNATTMLSQFMVNGTPDERSFFDTVAPIMKRARRSGMQVRAFGEMVALLWERGETSATIQLENLWNKFSESEKFCLFCAYPKNGFENDASASVTHICSTHTKVIGSDLNFPLELQYRKGSA